jgi:hypothetical protein
VKHEPTGEIAIGECGLEDGQWHEYTSNYDSTIQGGTVKDYIGPSEVKVFIKVAA